MTPLEIDNPSCAEGMTEPHLWIVHIFEICFAVLSMIANCVITVVSRQARPISLGQRKMIASSSMNFALLGGFQFSRNIFLIFSMYNPCINLVSTISCKLQEFPLLFCYIHSAILIVVISLQAKTNDRELRRHLPWTATCGVWQSALVVVSAACTLLFTAFDKDNQPENMQKCVILLAIRNRELGFWLLTFLIISHTVALIVIFISASFTEHPPSHATVMAVSLKEVITVETLLWHSALLITGVALLYLHVIMDPEREIINLVIEISFVFVPIIISFIHPVLLIWNVFPMRDAAVRVFPLLQSMLPEYALVPPPAPKPKGSPMPVAKAVVLTMNNNHTDEEKKRLKSPLLPKK